MSIVQIIPKLYYLEVRFIWKFWYWLKCHLCNISGFASVMSYMNES